MGRCGGGGWIVVDGWWIDGWWIDGECMVVDRRWMNGWMVDEWWMNGGR